MFNYDVVEGFDYFEDTDRILEEVRKNLQRTKKRIFGALMGISTIALVGIILLNKGGEVDKNRYKHPNFYKFPQTEVMPVVDSVEILSPVDAGLYSNYRDIKLESLSNGGQITLEQEQVSKDYLTVDELKNAGLQFENISDDTLTMLGRASSDGKTIIDVMPSDAKIFMHRMTQELREKEIYNSPALAQMYKNPPQGLRTLIVSTPADLSRYNGRVPTYPGYDPMFTIRVGRNNATVIVGGEHSAPVINVVVDDPNDPNQLEAAAILFAGVYYLNPNQVMISADSHPLDRPDGWSPWLGGGPNKIKVVGYSNPDMAENFADMLNGIHMSNGY